LKILHVIYSADPTIGGPIENVKQLGAVLTGNGHQVEVASLDGPDAPHWRNFPFPAYPLGPGVGKYGYSKRLLPWLRENVTRYNVVIVNGIWQYNSFAAWRALRSSSTPYVAYPHGALDPWFKRAYPLKHVKKWMYWPWAEYRVLRDARAVLFTSRDEALLARRSFWLHCWNGIVVGNGTAVPAHDSSAEKAVFLSQYPNLVGKRLALFIGRIHPKKGCDLLIKAFAAVLRDAPDWRLVIAGPDQVGWQAELISLAQREGVADRITWTGMISGKIKNGALENAEVLVLPSHQENFGAVLVEALARGTPVLISRSVNIWREIEESGAGISANDDLEGTCYLLRAWLAMPQQDRELMGRRAQECFRAYFDIRQVAHNVLQAIATSCGCS